MQVNLSVAIVAMVSSNAENNNTSLNQTDKLSLKEFTWDENTQGIILGAFFYGYFWTPILGGRLAEMFGGKRIFSYGILMASIFTILTPIAAKLNLAALIVTRILVGVGQGVIYPSMNVMLARWIPQKEQSQLAALVYVGSDFGTIISLTTCGTLCTFKFLGGWPMAFYIFGGIGVLWFTIWTMLIHDTPESHPKISAEELLFIQNSTTYQIEPNDKISTPWRNLLTCLPMWAVVVTNCGQDFIFFTILTELPTYMHNAMHFDIKSNGLLSSLPNINSVIFSMVWPFLANKLLDNGWISQVNSYKFWNSVSTVGPALCVIGVALAGSNTILVLVLLGAAGACISANFCSAVPNLIALSPQFAGTTFGISNSLSSTSGFLAPFITGSIINKSQDVQTWRQVFYVAAIVPIMANFFYLTFAKAEQQIWRTRK